MPSCTSACDRRSAATGDTRSTTAADGASISATLRYSTPTSRGQGEHEPQGAELRRQQAERAEAADQQAGQHGHADERGQRGRPGAQREPRAGGVAEDRARDHHVHHGREDDADQASDAEPDQVLQQG
ncbi:hypothetical protein GCM10010171_37960 [Actinokineospora fastidiosa]|uniref:Uncharacterized protein n=1 Tax=Actinokineospora fastidiosa TaxID=1816 RepID=A0A918GIX7_9PSEU|nr:hypothetical protein GCM10010171_37960 [Actinokineospora fastidiosa]